MMPQLPTNVPRPTALPRREAVVKPMETVTSVVMSQVRNTAPTVTVRQKQVRISIVPYM